MKRIMLSAGIALVVQLCGSLDAAEQMLFDWENPGDAQEWQGPDQKYQETFPLLGKAEQSTEKASTGKGSLKVAFDSTGEAAQKSRQGRVAKYYGGTTDWSSAKTLSAMCLVPEGAPAMTANLVVQSGGDWKWQAGESVNCVPGQWTPVSMNVETLSGLNQIQMIYLVVLCPSGSFQGSIFVDTVKLDGAPGGDAQPAATNAPGKPQENNPAATAKAGATPFSSTDTWIEDFETLTGWEKQNGAQLDVADSAAVGKGAVKFTSPGIAFKKVKGIRPLKPDSPNDGYEGISFWVKGDGSDMYGTLVLCGQHPLWFPFRYAYSFPLKDTEWKKIMVPWDKFVPEDPAYPVGMPGGMPPSGIQHVKIGSKWTIYHNNKPLPKFSYCIDQIQVEEKVASDPSTAKLRAFEDVLKLLKAKKPVNILCLGDSITAGTGLQSPDTERYAQVLEKLLRKTYGYDQIQVVSKAVGGAQGNDLRLWLERDFAGNPPDLVTIMYGYNDKTWGYPKEYFTYSMNDYLDRIARKTRGKTAVVLLSTIPGKNERFFMMDDYAECVRAIAKERGLPLCDVSKEFKAFGRVGIDAYLADQAHPNAKGHEVMANALLKTLSGK